MTEPDAARPGRRRHAVVGGEHFVKDLGIVLDQARALTFPLPMASAVHQLFLAAAAGGHGTRDDAFVIRVWQALAGIDLPEPRDA